MAEHKFPSEVIDLPSEGRLYPEGHPCKDGKIEIKYMTAKEEDILTSQNLIKKGVVIEKLLESLIVTPGVNVNDLLVGDKNAVMIAARILAYGPEYKVRVTNPGTGEEMEHMFDLTDCPFKELPEDVDYSKNEFSLELPISKVSVTLKFLTGVDEISINKEIESRKKIGQSSEVTTRLKHVITSVNGDSDKATVNAFAENMLSKESMLVRDEIKRIMPDIDLTKEVEFPSGETVSLDIPMTVDFFWPRT